MSETNEVVNRMVRGLESVSKDYALGYLESFLSGLIDEHVTDPVKLGMLRMKMLAVGIDALIDARDAKK